MKIETHEINLHAVEHGVKNPDTPKSLCCQRCKIVFDSGYQFLRIGSVRIVNDSVFFSYAELCKVCHTELNEFMENKI